MECLTPITRNGKDIEEIIRDEGVQPATLAILDGKIQIGLDPEILDAFAKFRNVEKVSECQSRQHNFFKKARWNYRFRLA